LKNSHPNLIIVDPRPVVGTNNSGKWDIQSQYSAGDGVHLNVAGYTALGNAAWAAIQGKYAPAANFSATPLAGNASLHVTFTDLSTNAPSAWSWDFGDGTTSTLKNPDHVYTTAGTYPVTLNATNGYGSSVITKSNYISVANSGGAPSANFSANSTSGAAPKYVMFTDSSTGSPTSWKWNFGDGYTSTYQHPVHLYNMKGIYTVTLNATNSAGSGVLTRANYIVISSSETAPVANFIAKPTTGIVPLAVSFNDTSTGNITRWEWDLDGNGIIDRTMTNSANRNITVYRYMAAGTYSPKLTVQNSAGSSSVVKSVQANRAHNPYPRW
jgi:PKD repeat protein